MKVRLLFLQVVRLRVINQTLWYSRIVAQCLSTMPAIATAQIHPAKPDNTFFACANPARGLEIGNGLEIGLPIISPLIIINCSNQGSPWRIIIECSTGRSFLQQKKNVQFVGYKLIGYFKLQFFEFLDFLGCNLLSSAKITILLPLKLFNTDNVKNRPREKMSISQVCNEITLSSSNNSRSKINFSIQQFFV